MIGVFRIFLAAKSAEKCLILAVVVIMIAAVRFRPMPSGAATDLLLDVVDVIMTFVHRTVVVTKILRL